MDLELKCPHCDRWTSSEAKSCSKCGSSLFQDNGKADSSSNWKWVIGAAVLLMAGVLVVNLTKPDYLSASSVKDFYSKPSEKRRDAFGRAPSEAQKPAGEPDKVAGDLGYYGQWDENGNGYLEGEELTKASAEINQEAAMVVNVAVTDINGEIRSGPRFHWRPPQDVDLDQRISKQELEYSNGFEPN